MNVPTNSNATLISNRMTIGLSEIPSIKLAKICGTCCDAGTLLKLFGFHWSLAYLSKTSGGVSPISETDVARSVAGENFKAPSSLKLILRFAMSNINK